MRSWRSKAVAGSTAALMILTANIAFADSLEGDELTVIREAGGLALGTVCAGEQANGTLNLAIRRQGGGAQVYADGATVAVSPHAATTGLTAGSASGSISIPQNWEGAANGTFSPSVTATVSLLTNSVGSFTGSVTYRSTGPNSSGTTRTFDDMVPVTANVVDCAPADTTPPVITPGVSGSLGQNGWYRSDVSLTWTVTDAESVISSSSGCSAVSITADQGETTYTCTATSAGGTSSRSVTIKRDATPPVITPGDVVDTTWRNTALSQAFVASDATSGLATATDANFTLTASDESTATTPTTATKTVTDAAGNSTTRTLSALIDTTAPEIRDDGPTTSPNAAGWYKTDVVNRFTASDALSGLAASFTTSFTKTTTGEGTSVSVSSGAVSDVAGNTNTGVSSAAFKIDKTAPTSVVAGVTAGAVYGVAPTVTCAASDGLSDVKSPGTPTGNTAGAGVKSVTCNGATDHADNVQTDASPSVSYTLAPIGGFNSNFDGSAVLRVKPNQAIPLKWAFNDGTTNVALLSGASLSSVSSTRCIAGGTDGTEEAATEFAAGASGLQLLTDNSYQMNWKATSTTGCRALTVTMAFKDGGSTSRTILVNIAK